MTEMAAQLLARQAELDLQWILRNQNDEADGLTNEDFSQFDPSRKIMVEIERLKFLILPKMTKAADKLYSEAKRNKEAAKSRALQRSPTKLRPLKDRDLWL